MKLFASAVILALAGLTAALQTADPLPKAYLEVNKNPKDNWPGFTFRGEPVFLSGANQAWVNYGSDFGNTQTRATRCSL